MKLEECEQMREYVRRWKETGAFLEKLRREEMQRSNLAESIAAFDAAFHSALYLSSPEKTSGLIEFHQLLAKTR